MVDSYVLTALLLIISGIGCAPSLDMTMHSRSERIQDFVERHIRDNESPGLQYVVVDLSGTLFSHSAGLADIKHGKPMEDHTTQMAYSMTKTITAAAILQLVERGSLSLDDQLIKHIPEAPYGDDVTIRHLLNQTSGIPNPIPLSWVHLVDDHPAFDEEQALKQILIEHPDPDVAPGEEYAYSNISYWLLGHIISRTSGMSYEDFVRQNVFRRLDIPESEIGFVIPSRQGHAKGYLREWSMLDLVKSFVIDDAFIGEYENGWLHIRDHYLNGPAFGGIVATARAMSVFLRDQLQEHSALFSRETHDLFFARQQNNDGEPIDMTPGWHIGEQDGTRYFYKEGGGGGFHSMMRVYPDSHIGTVVIANNTSFDAGGFLDVADKEFIDK